MHLHIKKIQTINNIFQRDDLYLKGVGFKESEFDWKRSDWIEQAEFLIGKYDKIMISHILKKKRFWKGRAMPPVKEEFTFRKRRAA